VVILLPTKTPENDISIWEFEWPSGAASFGPRLLGLRGAPGQWLDGSEKAIISGRPANILGGAQAAEQVRLRITGKQIADVGEALLDGCQRGTSISLDRRQSARTRPPPSCARSTARAPKPLIFPKMGDGPGDEATGRNTTLSIECQYAPR
jgi:hypothetical protein